MGQSSSSTHHHPNSTVDPLTIVDGGYLIPFGVYKSQSESSSSSSKKTKEVDSDEEIMVIVRQLIVDRKLAPFYQGLDALVETGSPSVTLRPPPQCTRLCLYFLTYNLTQMGVFENVDAQASVYLAVYSYHHIAEHLV